MSEQFSIQALNANGIPITPPQDTRSEEGYLKDLIIQGILEIMSGGKITNTAGTYIIDDNGIEFEVDASNDLNPVAARNVSFRYDVNNVAYVQGAYDTVSGRMTLVLGADSDVESYVEVVVDAMLIANRFLVSQSLNRSIAKFEVTDTTEATSTTTGSVQTAGGLGVAKNLHVGGTLVSPIQTVKFIEGLDSPYTVLSNDVTLLVDTSLSAVTLNLPTGTDGRKVTVKHIAGTASTESITINRAGSNTIEGNTSYTIDTDYGHVTLIFYNGVWYII